MGWLHVFYMVKFLPWCVWRIRMWSWNVFLGAEETSEINQSFATYSTKSWHHKLLTNPRILPYFPPVSYPFSKGISWPSVQGPFLLGHQGSRCHSCEWLGTGDLGEGPKCPARRSLVNGEWFVNDHVLRHFVGNGRDFPIFARIFRQDVRKWKAA